MPRLGDSPFVLTDERDETSSSSSSSEEEASPFLSSSYMKDGDGAQNEPLAAVNDTRKSHEQQQRAEVHVDKLVDKLWQSKTMTENTATTTTTDEKPPQTPLPKKKMFVLLCIVFSEGFSGTMLFPFIAFMVQSFGVADDDKDIGYYAGYVTSAFYLGMFCSNFFWGWLSDRKGRRPVLLAGMAGNAVTTLLFGSSHTFYWALASRFLNGSLNGVSAVTKTYIAEVTDETNQALGFSLRAAGYGLGGILGPLLGGVLAAPAKRFAWLEGTLFDGGPEVGEGGLIGAGGNGDGASGGYPYLLPCMVAATVNVIGLVFGYFFLTESLPEIVAQSEEAKKRKAKEERKKQNQKMKMKKKEKGLLSGRERANKGWEDVEGEDGTSVLGRIRGWIKERTKKRSNSAVFIPLESLSTEEPLSEEEQDHQAEDEMEKQDEESLQDEEEDDETQAITEPVIVAPEKRPSMFSILKDKWVMVTTALYCGVCFVDLAFVEVYSVWSLNSPDDPQAPGLGFDSLHMGLPSACAAISIVLFQLFCYSPIDRRLGSLKTYRMAIGTTVFLIGVFPSLHFLVGVTPGNWLMWALLLPCYAFIRLWTVGAYAAISILINNAAGRSRLGLANGMATALGAFVCMLGPSFGGSMFAMSVQGSTFPFNYHFAFLVFSVLHAINWLCTFTVPASINARKR